MTGTIFEVPAAKNLPLRRSAGAQIKRFVLLLTITAIVVWSFWGSFEASWARLQNEAITLSWHLPVAIALFALAVPVSGLLWGTTLRQLGGKPVDLREAAAAHVIAWVLKYAPGQIGAFAYKVYWGNQRGHSSRCIGLSFIYENLYLQIASYLPAVVIISFAFLDYGNTLQFLLIAFCVVILIGFLVVLMGPGMYWVVKSIDKRWPGDPSEKISGLPPAQNIKMTILYLAPRLMNGAGFVLIALNLSALMPSAWLPLGAIYVLAGAFGILAVFVPSGLGVREAVIVIFAQAYVGIPTAIILAALARLISIVADMVALSIYGALRAIIVWRTK